jgi:hypothetical protein
MDSVWSALLGHAGSVLTRYSTRKSFATVQVFRRAGSIVEGHFGSPD